MIDLIPLNSKDDIERRSGEMKESQSGIRNAIVDLEVSLKALQEMNSKIKAEQDRAHELQKTVILEMAEILTQTEEQEKRSAELTMHTLKRMSDLIQMDGGEEKVGEGEEKVGEGKEKEERSASEEDKK